MGGKLDIVSYFEDIVIIKDYDPYFCSIPQAISLLIVGTFCGYKNIMQIQEWAEIEEVKEILKVHFGIEHIPCYYWLTRLLQLADADSMNECFNKWVESLLPDTKEGFTIAIDGKTICSTANMQKFEKSLHIVSAQIAELGLTFAQKAVGDKTNEIPTVQSLIKTLKIKGCVIVADALNCQKKTAKAIVEKEADYLLSVKDNQTTLKQDIEDFVQDEKLQKTMEHCSTSEKNRNRIEKRTAYVTTDIKWLTQNHKWEKLTSFGAIHKQVSTKNGKSSEWHYYISSKSLSPEELLQRARLEWSVETMHWLLDVNFGEDNCRLQNDIAQKNLNIIRKIVINSLRVYKDKTKSKKAFTSLMIKCHVNPKYIFDICSYQN